MARRRKNSVFGASRGSSVGENLLGGLAGGLFAAIAKVLSPAPSKARLPMATLGGGDGSYAIDVVGESQYLPALRRIAGRGEVRMEVTAELWLEDDNPHDNKAVQVRIEGETVGYLRRGDARSYRKQIDAAGHGPFVGRCPAIIIGGGRGRENLGVWLDLPEA